MEKNAYIDHKFDDLFRKALNDGTRPKDFNPYWWAIYNSNLLVDRHNSSDGFRALLELPFRTDEELQTEDYMVRIIKKYKNLKPEDKRTMLRTATVWMGGKLHEFGWYKPEENLLKRYLRHQDEVTSVLYHFASPDEFPNPRSYLDG